MSGLAHLLVDICDKRAADRDFVQSKELDPETNNFKNFSIQLIWML